jgi:hypothetical protein
VGTASVRDRKDFEPKVELAKTLAKRCTVHVMEDPAGGAFVNKFTEVVRRC